MKQKRPYKRLPGRRRTSFSVSTLWLGDGHLLAVEKSIVEERYRRYYFADLQAFLVRPTFHWHITTLVSLVLAAVFLFPSWQLWNEGEELFILPLIPALLCLVVLVVNLVLGRSCRTSLQMKVGVHDLPSLRRLGKANRVLDRIRPLIREAQKDIRVSDRVEQNPVMRAVQKVDDAKRAYGGLWHLVLYATLLVDIVVSILHTLLHSEVYYYLSMLFGVAVVILVIVCLVAQHNTRLADAARAATWVLFAGNVVGMVCGYFYYTFYFIYTDPELLVNQSKQFSALANLDTLDHPFLLALLVAYVVIGLICMAISVPATLRLRREAA